MALGLGLAAVRPAALARAALLPKLLPLWLPIRGQPQCPPSKNLLTVLFFMLNTMGQDCKDEKLSQQTASQGIRKILP